MCQATGDTILVVLCVYTSTQVCIKRMTALVVPEVGGERGAGGGRGADAAVGGRAVHQEHRLAGTTGGHNGGTRVGQSQGGTDSLNQP